MHTKNLCVKGLGIEMAVRKCRRFVADDAYRPDVSGGEVMLVEANFGCLKMCLKLCRLTPLVYCRVTSDVEI